MRNLMRDVLEIILKWSLNWISLCAKLLTLFFQIMDQKFQCSSPERDYTQPVQETKASKQKQTDEVKLLTKDQLI
jgi:hypothetical protein